MKLLTVNLLLLFILVVSCTADLFLFAPDAFFSKQDGVIECPEACPANSEPICTSNGFCIKLFDSPCQALYYNCKNKEEYKHIHQQYCEVPRFKNLQPQACFNNTITSTTS